MKKKSTKIILSLVLVLAVMQFIQPEKTNPESSASSDFIAVNGVEGEVGSLLKMACYDCHSNHTVWPWYASVAPVSYVVVHHVNEGREHLNFSEWGNYSQDRAAHKLEECVEEIEEGEMPMSGYVALHSEADLTDAELGQLMDLFDSLR